MGLSHATVAILVPAVSVWSPIGPELFFKGSDLDRRQKGEYVAAQSADLQTGGEALRPAGPPPPPRSAPSVAPGAEERGNKFTARWPIKDNDHIHI